ncbi:MAG: thioesterase family protein [Bacteroidales bacterium]|nr:thioesterase family protein [Porphyromonas sp.]MDD6934184.1 thioesterase family protein [Bacteroidales bacterium]MDY3102161.1 thioesterase family protein [Porphyromonas sp.]
MLPLHQTHQIEIALQDHHSAIHVGSGDLPVFGTPAMIALMENASVQLVAPYLEEGASTVGIHLEVDHTRATAIGQTVRISATLEAVDGRKLSFSLLAEDDKGEIGRGTLERFIVYREKFMSKLA